jgi:hypothetical protein
MAYRSVPAFAFALLLLGAGQAGAQEPASKPAAWPDNLKHRNARYAALGRVDDPEGDAHERLVAHMEMVRVHDDLGDLDQMARARLSGHRPPRDASVHARLERAQDADGDQHQTVVAGLPGTRQFAETRRFRDLGGDQVVLADYRRDQRRMLLDHDDRILMGDGEEPALRRDFFDRRDSMIDPMDGESEAETERSDETEAERRTDRQLQREEERRHDAATDRVLDHLGDEIERQDEANTERQDEADAERIEDSTERSDETEAERADDRQTERQQTRDDEQATGDE